MRVALYSATNPHGSVFAKVDWMAWTERWVKWFSRYDGNEDGEDPSDWVS